ncbi:SusC/RagA family TonB-linked outer membrane protein [Ohtaekwangia koreensis]|uniref:TonB-linked outer membrane protein, SusC/RagA family n=1 Tax=Ohtaekwangia koreensis TaxID=688867 RepID=A0A1T5KLX4_9BACT|nr:TonB-dependent receptor [Ohtaekwangia koreensis]SKC64485.1 TonB-linked outer membrane protein, SusC/RagA family [Ohtaekwangia koreensis]
MKRGLLRFVYVWRCSWCLHIVFLLSLISVTANAQTTVRGRIVDETGTSLPGVNVIIKGTSSGTTSDGDGGYSIQVPDQDAVLVFSFIGYTATEETVGNRAVIDVTLSPNIQSLSEVVVVGYGTQRQEAVTGSVVSMSGNTLRDMPSPNISQALQGRAVGVDISQTSSKPGTAMQIRVRGTRSLLASNDPLLVVDGIPFAGSINDIDPNSIKSIDILKDASATAIYGSRGANGVLLITTNRGTKGQKAQVSYNGYHGVKTVFAKYPMMNGPEFAALRATSAQKFNNTLDESNDVNTDWQDMIYKNAMVTSHDVGMSGGTEKGTYYFGAGYFRDEAVVPLQNFTRYSMRFSLDQEINKYIRIGINSNSNYSITNGDNVPAVSMALGRSPIANPYNADGTMKEIIQESTTGAQWVPSRGRFESLGDKYVDKTKAYGTYNTVYTEIGIPGVEGLKYRLNLGLSMRQSNYGNYTGEGVFSGVPTTPSTAAISSTLMTNWAAENLLTYDRSFGKHDLNAVLLYSAQQETSNTSRVTARDIPADQFQFYNLGRADGVITVNPADQSYTQWGLLSYMGRVMYSYDDRYMLSATFRSDGSSRLASGHKWHTYPAISVGWNISRESFMTDISQLNLLKLRVGYGQTSNQSVSPYQTLGLLSTRPYNFGDDTYSTGFTVSQLPNAELGWEYSQTFNYGLDFKAFDNRLSGTVEYYVQDTKDVLLPVGLPSTSGVSSITANMGQTQNKGIEITLNGTIIDNLNGWSWDLGFNLYANRNELVSLASGQLRDEGNWWFVGHPIDVIYDYEKIGLWQEGDQHLGILEPGSASKPGMIKVKYTGEYNADGTPVRAINAQDRQIINIQPNFQGGFNTRVAYKGIDLSIVGTFKNGGILNSTLYGSAGYLNNLNSRAGNNVRVDYWTPENTDAKYPAPGGVGGDNPKYGSTLGYFDASYLKIRTITLGYNVPRQVLAKAGISNLRVYVAAQNPFVMFSPYHDESGMDPETNSYGNENAAVPYSSNLRRILTVGTNTPSTRNYLLGLNLTF